MSGGKNGATPQLGERERPPGGSVADRVLGVAGAAMVIAAAILLLVSVGRGDGEVPVSDPPSLDLLSPRAGEAVTSPLELTFRSGAPVAPGPGGWGTRQFHLHASIGGVEAMAGPEDIRRIGEGLYSWSVGRVDPGDLEVRMFWSDQEHRPIEGATTQPVVIKVD